MCKIKILQDQLKQKYRCISSVCQGLAPLDERIQREKLSGLCDALSLHYIAVSAKGRQFPKDNAGFGPGELDQIVGKQRKHLNNQQGHAKKKLIGMGIPWVNRDFYTKNVVNTPTTADGFKNIVERNKAHVQQLIDNPDGLKQIAKGPAWLYAMFYLHQRGAGDHNCCGVFAPDGSVEYFDPNIGAFRFRGVDECSKFFELLQTRFAYGQTMETLFFIDKVVLMQVPGFTRKHRLI